MRSRRRSGSLDSLSRRRTSSLTRLSTISRPSISSFPTGLGAVGWMQAREARGRPATRGMTLLIRRRVPEGVLPVRARWLRRVPPRVTSRGLAWGRTRQRTSRRKGPPSTSSRGRGRARHSGGSRSLTTCQERGAGPGRGSTKQLRKPSAKASRKPSKSPPRRKVRSETETTTTRKTFSTAFGMFLSTSDSLYWEPQILSI
mmetsp:Transcript_62592/g.149042  ORF Transcript_62592/g.149042 Transcript_62592/m.149042 type:complete len:201 (-) Transcript_62592:62-664(-)